MTFKMRCPKGHVFTADAIATARCDPCGWRPPGAVEAPVERVQAPTTSQRPRRRARRERQENPYSVVRKSYDYERDVDEAASRLRGGRRASGWTDSSD